MFRQLQQIAETAYNSAQHRGKDVSCIGCLSALREEQQEYFAAFDAEKHSNYTMEDIKQFNKLTKKEEVISYYDAKLHNTTYDELADIMLVAATWLNAARLAAQEAGEEFKPDRNYDVMLLMGAVAFVIDRINDVTPVLTIRNADKLRHIINAKIAYNFARKD